MLFQVEQNQVFSLYPQSPLPFFFFFLTLYIFTTQTAARIYPSGESLFSISASLPLLSSKAFQENKSINGNCITARQEVGKRFPRFNIYLLCVRAAVGRIPVGFFFSKTFLNL